MWLRSKLLFFCITCNLCLPLSLVAQCVNAINAFPYTEDFEANNGNWVTGGTSSDWIWGTPSKNVINRAGSGTKCWMTGSLTSGGYNNGQNSWVQSPCFDLSGLVNPQLAFKIFWETEKRYDGASLQYSIDNGNNWQVLGSINSNSNCTGSNWFNTASVTSLGYTGWSGNIQPTSPCSGGAGDGSGSWLIAKHTLVNLAGQTGVLFRFTFAAGTQCNTYDGFAIDSISISEALPNTASFNYNCTGNNSISFFNTSSACAISYAWNFGDPSSGSNNFSGAENPSHVFSSPGIYNIALQVAYPGNILVSASSTITVIGVTTNILQNILCNGNATGSVTALVNGANGSFNYEWNTTPPQTTATINQLAAGTYTVTVSGNNVCATTATITLSQPTPITAQTQITNVICQKKGSILTNISGGTEPYTYTWNNGNNNASLLNINKGVYDLTVTDNNGCSVLIQNINVDSTTNSIAVALGNDTSFCPGNQLTLNAGSFANYIWHNNSNSSTFIADKTGIYWVKVTDADGCTASDTLKVTVDCSDLFFPTAFTPDKNGLNDLFGPIGNLASVRNYSFQIFGRWGDVVFNSTNPYFKWNGKIKGKDADAGTFIWTASYAINGQPVQQQRGIVVLIK